MTRRARQLALLAVFCLLLVWAMDTATTHEEGSVSWACNVHEGCNCIPERWCR